MKNIDNNVECEEINDVDDEDDNDGDDDENEECDVNNIYEGTSCHMKKCGKKLLIQTLISSGNFDDQCYLLKSFLSSPELKEHVHKLRIYQPEDEMKIESFDNLAKVMSLSSPKKKRNIKNETKCFQDCVISTIVPTSLSLNKEEVSPENNETSKISRKQQALRNKIFADSFEMSKRSVQRKVKHGGQKRNEMIQGEGTSFKEWLKIPVKKGYSKITPSVISALNNWIFNHDNVTKLSHTKDTMKIKIDGTNEKRTVPKYYLQIPICELHADMIKPVENGGLQEAKDETGTVIISETMLRKKLPPNVKLM